jgi:protein subunit release factor A
MACTVFDDKHRIFLGTHRIQRVSVTEKNNRRHTSFVSVFEVVEDSNQIVLVDSDINTETFRGSGAGGQHRNKTDSCVRMTHVPTGVSVIATEQRSQHQNKKVARQRLESKLLSGPVQISVLANQQWNWCQWRDEVSLPSGKKKNMSKVLKRGL